MLTFKKKKWVKLDNAAKIFPPISNKRDSKVFRFACELFENIDPIILQQATTKTINIFPIFKSVLKKGLFWYYLEESEIVPKVEEENIPPCLTIYDRNKKSLLFRVNYYNKRINFEVYHALTDGTGALEFIKTLAYNYIIVKYKEDFINIPLLDIKGSYFQRESDSFKKYYNPKGNKKMIKVTNSYQIKGQKYPKGLLNIIEGTVSVKKILKLAHQYDSTITVFLTAVLIKAIEIEMNPKEKKYGVVVTIPINLRKYFKSMTVRNFFGVTTVGYKSSDEYNFDKIIKKINKDLKKELMPSKIKERIDYLSSIENNVFVRPIPIFIKDLILKLAYHYTIKDSTVSLSNIGKIEMPEGFDKYIKQFDIFISTDKLQLCLCSYQDELTLSFSSIFENKNIQKNFFRILTNYGLEVEVVTNILDKEN